jgi:putative redox protein
MVTARMNWEGGLRFTGTSTFGHTIVTDGGRQAGGEESGYKPTELLLFGMAGCSGIDIVRVLTKMRQEITSLEIEVIAHQQEEYPKPFHTIEVKIVARGKNLDESKLARAIELSEDKYCVVTQTVKEQSKVITSYEIIDE